MIRSFAASRLGRSVGAFALAAALLTGPSPSKAEPAEFLLDPDHTYITFFVSHIGYSDLAGMFLESSGSFTYDEDAKELKNAKITVNTDSVFSNHTERDKHLKSADFLNTREFPEMTFVATKAEKLSDTEGKVTGDLTLLGVTKPITLDVTYNKAGNYPFGDGHYALGFDATASFKRSDFGMSYGVDGNIVGDEIKLVIGVEGIRQ
ncbi:MAG: YceI family protein [Alphaproteobacteria bacterium]|nr:YceI family protein [Alphaproteobacteria bacterium]